MTLIERPIAAMATKAATTEIGMASETTSVARAERRKIRRMIAARVPPNQMFCRTSEIDDLM